MPVFQAADVGTAYPDPQDRQEKPPYNLQSIHASGPPPSRDMITTRSATRITAHMICAGMSIGLSFYLLQDGLRGGVLGLILVLLIVTLINRLLRPCFPGLAYLLVEDVKLILEPLFVVKVDPIE